MAKPSYITIRTCDLGKAQQLAQMNSATRDITARAIPCFTEDSRGADEVTFFCRDGLTDAELAQYARRTAKRPLLCFLAIAASPFITEGLCRLLGAW